MSDPFHKREFVCAQICLFLYACVFDEDLCVRKYCFVFALHEKCQDCMNLLHIECRSYSDINIKYFKYLL